MASLTHKSAIVYYGEHISYPMVGLHDYIIVQPEHINTHTHGFKVYKNKMYAYISINEIDTTIKEYAKVNKKWIVAENKAWDSKVLDIRNMDYQEFMFHEMIEPRIKEGFQNFFIDTLDSYEIAFKSKKELVQAREALAHFINEFKRRYPNVKIIINRGFNIIDEVHNSVEAVLFESYYYGLGGKNLGYKAVSDEDRVWLDAQIAKVKKYNLDVIAVDYLPYEKRKRYDAVVKKLEQKGFIPYVATKDLDIYGRSSKNALKREILTILDERVHDRMLLAPHQYGQLILEYYGYIMDFKNITQKLPSLEQMSQYGGVIIWTSQDYEKPKKLYDWVVKLKNAGIKVVFAGNFASAVDSAQLSRLGIAASYSDVEHTLHIAQKSAMMDYEIKTSLNIENLYLQPKDAKSLVTFENELGEKSVMAAITPWGGYAIGSAFMTELDQDNLWVINPFQFFKEALHLQDFVVPDPTTENGRRLLFSHIDGDGITSRVEWDTKMMGGESIYKNILTKYKIPHSVSIVGASVNPEGIYPKDSKKTIQTVRKIYALDNVEPATHTYSHPFFWQKIKNDHLDAKYRLPVKNYNFSLDREIGVSLKNINQRYIKKGHRRAHTVFWSGDCSPPYFVLDYVYKHNILNINGGDTYITNTKPWLSYIAPFGVERDEYYQIYTGAQDENVYTNDWLGPFWGFKKVVQTFKLTNSPRRFKPIDIYYHYYSGTKRAALNALYYVFDWALKQDVMPIYTTEYIPKAMDFYSASLAKEGDDYYVAGCKDLKNLRVEDRHPTVDFNTSVGVLGERDFENHTYISLAPNRSEFLVRLKKRTAKKDAYLKASNAKVVAFKRDGANSYYHFKGWVDLKLLFSIPSNCHIRSDKVWQKKEQLSEGVQLHFKNIKEAQVYVLCR